MAPLLLFQRHSISSNTISVSMLLKILLFLCLNVATFVIGNDQFSHSGFSDAKLLIDGAAIVTSNGLLELTNGTDPQKGHAFYNTPLSFKSSPNGTVQSFTSFVFAVLSVYTDLSAHGMAFVVAPSTNFSGALPGQFLGLTDIQNNDNSSNHFFAVELDTIQNKEFNDLNANHAGANINGLKSVESYYAGYYADEDGNFHNLSLISRELMQVWIDYDESNKHHSCHGSAKGCKTYKTTLYSHLQPHNSDYRCCIHRLLLCDWHNRYTTLYSPLELGPTWAIDIDKLPKLPRVGPKARSKVLDIVLPVTTAVFVLIVGTSILLLIRRHLRYIELREAWKLEFGPHRFSYKDLFYATEGFKDKHLLGIGGFGRVYKGILPVSKLQVAVKRVSHDSKQGMKEFIAEIVSIGRIQHCNLVRVLGYSRRRGELFLVYEYMPNGSVDKYLYGEDRPTLNWANRWRIINGIASCLLYLHEEWEKVVLHRDIKPSNVLLDSDMNGRLGDFGLARLYDHDTDPQTTHVVGTIGYLAPGIGHTCKATPLTDVFAFGIFLLEITCGRRPISESIEDSQCMLVDWVLEQWKIGRLVDTVDSRLQGNYNVDEACLALKLGLLCSHPFSNARPTMRRVMQYLDGVFPLPEISPTDLIFHMMAIMQNEGFDNYITGSTNEHGHTICSFWWKMRCHGLLSATFSRTYYWCHVKLLQRIAAHVKYVS